MLPATFQDTKHRPKQFCVQGHFAFYRRGGVQAVRAVSRVIWQKIPGDIVRPQVSKPPPMNDPTFQQHGGAHAAEHPPRGPYWKRMHHSAFFWVAAGFISLAMIIYVTTNNLSSGPGDKLRRPVPALAP